MAAPPACGWSPARPSPPTSWCECRLGLDLSQDAATRGAQALDRPQAGPVALLDGSVPLVFRHQPAVPGCGAPYDRPRPALSRAADRHLQAQAPVQGLLAVPAPADGNRSVPGAGGL